MEKTKRRKFRFKRFFCLLFILLSLGIIIYLLCNVPLRNIDIDGNIYLKDNYIIDYLNLNNTKIFKISKNEIENKLLQLDLISDVKVKKNILGKLYIKVKEENVLFYNLIKNKIVLSSGEEIEVDNTDLKDYFLGIPILVNSVPDDIYEEFIVKLKKISKNNLSLISEIEYSPTYIVDKETNKNKPSDAKRFLLRMNDGNIVFINIPNIEKFNGYLEVYEGIVNKNGDVKGCLYLDSKSENNHFNNCEGEKGINEDGEN